MAKQKSKAVVIDADIACNAGDKPLPTAENCRALFNVVKTKNYHVVMSPDIRIQWKNHASNRSKVWLRQMVGQKQVDFIGNVHNEEFRAKMRQTVDVIPIEAKDKRLQDMEEDYHLLEAALAADKIVFSCDENTARKLFQQAAVTVAEIRPILWANPDLPEDGAVAWLQRGAPNEAKRRLGYQQPK